MPLRQRITNCSHSNDWHVDIFLLWCESLGLFDMYPGVSLINSSATSTIKNILCNFKGLDTLYPLVSTEKLLPYCWRFGALFI